MKSSHLNPDMKLNASHILTRWRRVCPVLRKPSLWFLMLRIAECGAHGVSRSAMINDSRLKTKSLGAIIKKLRLAGLVEEFDGPRRGPGQVARMARITPAGLEFLGIGPTPPQSHAEA